MTHLLEFLYSFLVGLLTGVVIARVIIFIYKKFWPRTPHPSNLDTSILEELRRTVAKEQNTRLVIMDTLEQHSAKIKVNNSNWIDLLSKVNEMSEHRFKTNLTPEHLEELDKEATAILSSDTTLRDGILESFKLPAVPDQLYYFKDIESSQDDAFSDVTGDRLYMTESGIATFDAFEKTNEKYLARYTAPGKVLKYNWSDIGAPVTLVEHPALRVHYVGPVRKFVIEHYSYTSLNYPTLLDAQLAAEYYYDNYIKQ